MVRFSLGVLAVAVLFATDAFAAPPKIEINGVTANDNTAVPHLKKLSTMTLKLTGTPNAPFCLMLSADANDGTGGEPNVTTGYFLEPLTQPGVKDLPILPVFDGIGMEFIRQKLNLTLVPPLAPDDIVNDTPSPLFRFDANGQFILQGLVPPTALMVNLTPTPGNPNPFSIDLESSGATVQLYMQIVELNTQNLSVTVGNGMKVIFDALTWSGSLAYSQGTDTVSTSTIVTQRQTLSAFTDTDLSDNTVVAPTTAPDFAGTFANALDFWLINLSGVQPLYATSTSPTQPANITQPDPDVVLNIQACQNQFSSSLEFLTGNGPVKNNENREFPRIECPGNKALFHWQNASNLSYGFGILFKDTNTWRNLVPASFGTFTESATRSPWEVEVTVTPDGKRAVVVLDRTADTNDRVFMLNLEPGGLFSNGQPIYEFVPSAADTGFFRRIFEESMQCVSDGAGSWVAFFTTSPTATGLTTFPNHMYRINLADSAGNPIPQVVLPGAAPNAGILRMERQPVVSPDRTTVCIPAGTTTFNDNENIYRIANVTPFSHTVENVTAFTASTVIAETNDATDGNNGNFDINADATLVAFGHEDGTKRWPMVARLKQSNPPGSVINLINSIANGGLFDDLDYPTGRDYHFAKDNLHLVFQQGLTNSASLSDRYDIFVVNINTKLARNLTRTQKTDVNGTVNATLLGPWDAPGNPLLTRPTVEPAGSWISRNGDWAYYVRELRGLPSDGSDRSNLLAISIAPEPNSSAASFFITNVTGTEFPPYDGLPKPTEGAPDVHCGGTATVDSFADYYHLRRVGGTGPFAEYYYFTAKLVNDNDANAASIDQIFLFDGLNPGPAIQVTNFTTSSSPIAVSANAKILNVMPNADEDKVLFILDADGTTVQTQKQDLILADFANFATPTRVPPSADATPFQRIITSGSVQWLKTSPNGIVYVSGTVPRPAGTTDGVAAAIDATNATDATPFFYRPIAPTVVKAIQGPIVAPVAARTAMIYNVKAN